MQGMKRFSLRYLLLDVALWALVFGSFIARNEILDLFPYSDNLEILVAVGFWFALAGAAIGGLLGSMRVGAVAGLAFLAAIVVLAIVFY